MLGRRSMKRPVYMMAVAVHHFTGQRLALTITMPYVVVSKIAFGLACTTATVMHTLLHVNKWPNTAIIDVQCIVEPPMGVLCCPSL